MSVHETMTRHSCAGPEHPDSCMRRFPPSGSRRREMDTKDTIYVPLRCRNAFAHYVSIILALGCVLSVIGLTRFRLSALQEPGLVETHAPNTPKHFYIRLASNQGIPSGQRIQAKALKQELHITVWIAAFATAKTARRKRRQDNGCTHALRISPVSECRATPMRSDFGSSATASDLKGCRASARLKVRTIFGVWSITCGHCRAETRARMPAEFEIALCS